MPYTSMSALMPGVLEKTITFESAAALGVCFGHDQVPDQRPPCTKKSANERSGVIRTATSVSLKTSNLDPRTSSGRSMLSPQVLNAPMAFLEENREYAETEIVMPSPSSVPLASTHAPNKAASDIEMLEKVTVTSAEEAAPPSVPF